MMSDLFTRPFGKVYRSRHLLGGTTLTELRSLYAGSVLGIAWIFLGPLFLLALYAIVYGAIFQVRPPSMSIGQYILYVLSGLVSFMAFAASLTAGATALIRNRQVLLNTAYPPELVAIRTTLVQSFPIATGLLFTIVALIFIGTPRWTLALVPLVVVFQVMFTCGLVLILSLVTLVLRDIQHVLQYVTFALLIVTPIGYDRAMVPAAIEWVMYANPLYYYVTAYQDLIVFGQLPPVPVMVIGSVGSILCYILAFGLFERVKQVFFEYA